MLAYTNNVGLSLSVIVVGLTAKLHEWIVLASQGEWFNRSTPSEKAARDNLSRDDADPLFASMEMMLRVIKKVESQVSTQLASVYAPLM